jgi:germination protein M
MRKLIALALALALVLTGCGTQTESQVESGGTAVYYLVRSDDARGSDAIRESENPLSPDGDTLTSATAIVERLLEDPEDEDLESPFPAGTQLLALELQRGRAYVDFSQEFSTLSGVDLLLADYCLTLSLTELEEISSVAVTVQGKALSQQPKQAFYRSDVLLSTMDDVVKTVEVTLYFFDSAGALVGEQRRLELYEGQTQAETLVDAYLEGPQDRELTAVTPEGFTVSSVHVEGNVCYLSVPRSALESLPEDEDAQWRLLWSLSQSIYSLEAVEELKLLCEGEELTLFGSVPTERVATRPQG